MEGLFHNDFLLRDNGDNDFLLTSCLDAVFQNTACTAVRLVNNRSDYAIHSFMADWDPNSHNHSVDFVLALNFLRLKYHRDRNDCLAVRRPDRCLWDCRVRGRPVEDK